VDRNGQQREGETQGEIALREGCHAMEVGFYQASGGAALTLEVSSPDSTKGPVPREWYFHLEDEKP
jgi:hypothetical protein